MSELAWLNSGWIRLLDGLPVPAFIRGVEGTIHYVNAAFGSLTSSSREYFVDRNVKDYVSSLGLRRLADEERRMLGGEVVNAETSFQIPGRRGEFTMLVTKSLARHPEWGDVIIVIGYEASGPQSFEQTETMVRVSHELQTPVSAIAGLAELLLDSPLDAEQRESVNLIQSTAESCRALLSDMLEASRPGLGQWNVRPTELALREFLDEILKPFALHARSSRLQFSYAVATEVPDRIYHDRLRLRQILQNLAGNAVKFTESGSVQVSVAVGPDWPDHREIQFSVKDTGIGISKEKQSEIFEPFVQSHGHSTRRYGGTGLGLSIASRIVTLLGGRIWVESELGQGSNFCFVVPVSLPRSSEITSAGARDGYDQNSALVITGGDLTLVKELAGLFLQEYPRLLADLRAAVKDGDPKKVDASAHALKGAVANFGARAAVEAALRIESKGRAGKTEGMDEALASLEQIFESLLIELKALYT